MDKVYSLLAHVGVTYVWAKARQAREQWEEQHQEEERARPGGEARPGRPWWATAVVDFYHRYGYRYANGACEAASFLHRLMYLYEHTPYFHPLLRLRRLVLCRLERSDLQEWGRQPAKVPFLQYSRLLLMLAYVAFQVLEWWYRAADGRTKQLPIPPPPAPPETMPGLEVDPTKCSLCSGTRTNPTLVATSGHVFCYPCISEYVAAHGCCPVTGIGASTANLRRLYEAL